MITVHEVKSRFNSKQIQTLPAFVMTSIMKINDVVICSNNDVVIMNSVVTIEIVNSI